jgi:hypothetical protein
MQQEASKVRMPGMPGLPAGSDENAQEGYEQMKGNMQ